MEVLHDNQDLQPVDFKAAFGVHCSPAVKTELTPNPNFGGGVGGFQATRVDEEDGVDKNENREIWLAQGDDDDVTNADPSPLFYGSDDFPSLPEFPCMSSSSSTSSTPAPNAGLSTSGATSSSSTSSSTSSSWAILKSDAEVEDDYQNLHRKSNNQLQQQRDQRCDDDGVGDCMNVMDDFDCMGINQLIEDSNEIWDPTPLFEEDQSQIPQTQTNLDPFTYPFDQEFCQSDLQQEQHQGGGGDDQPFLFLDPDNMEKNQSSSSCSALSEDLAVVFFEWLKSNKESISAEELRSIKIKKSTIESAAKRLGGGKEGMKQLLKLILQWVQNHRLQSKRSRSQSAFDFAEPTLPNPENPNPGLIINPVVHHEQLPPQCFNQQQQQCWIPPPPYIAADPAPSSFTSMVSYIGGHDPYGTVHQPYHAPDPYHHQQHHMINDGSTWGGQMAAPPQFPLAPPPQQPGPMHYNTGPGPDGSMMGYPGYASNGYNPYQFFSGDVVRMGSNMTTSATKEARKKRMARQRRMFSHHHHRAAHNNHNHHQHQQQQQMMMIQGGGDANCLDPNAAAARPVMMGDHDSGGWVYWPPTTPGGGPMQHMMQQQQQQPAVSERNGIAMTQAAGSQRQVAAAASDKKQGFRTEKNLKFLLQKVLKQSDVGNLGRIVLPKKEAETHLPELEARDGIPITMEDIGTSRVWNMRYRFWPNNKSRMYLLENTGDFVRSNGLQEGDFIVIYSDVKCGKYMIRGVKVRPQQQHQQQQGGSKAELAKKISKAQKTHNAASPAAAALSPFAHRQ